MNAKDLESLTNEEMKDILNRSEKPFPTIVHDYVYGNDKFIQKTFNADSYSRLNRVIRVVQAMVIVRFQQGLIN